MPGILDRVDKYTAQVSTEFGLLKRELDAIEKRYGLGGTVKEPDLQAFKDEFTKLCDP